GEDVVQETLANAVEASQGCLALDNFESWLFRIAHNAALDLLRRRARERAFLANEEMTSMTDTASPADQRFASMASLRTFMRLPVAQRSSVILMDVLGHSLGEIADIVGSTIPAVKASLHRGRARLRELAVEPENAPAPTLAPSEQALLLAYIDRFNARD